MKNSSPENSVPENNSPGESFEKKDSPKKSSSYATRATIETVALALLVFLVLHFTVENFLVDGPSMKPGLHTGEYVLVDKVAYVFHAPARGDVIVFALPQDTSLDLIKRVIALPGDTLVIKATTVTVNGVALNEPYISAADNGQGISLTVPPDDYFVMGDNRPNSDDSRDWGFVPKDNIIGKAMVVYWPLSNWQLINTYQPVYVKIQAHP